MAYHELSAASFADKIDVGRSSISHLLSGRNKPSLDFVMKIVDAFPEVELYWLLNGKGSFPAGKDPKKTPGPAVIPQETQDLFSESGKNEPVASSLDTGKQKQIQKILVLYEDGSFDAFEN